MATPDVNVTVNVQMHDKASDQIRALESKIIRFVGAVSAAFAALKAVAFPITEAAQFEVEMKNVQKTTNFTTNEVNALANSYLKLSETLGVNEIQLAKIGAIAGQMGLGEAGRKSVEEFTKSVAINTQTLGLESEKVANYGAQISKVFDLAIGDVERVFATLNELENSSVAKANDLADIILRVGNIADTSFQGVAALAATSKEFGVPNEQAGTGLVKFLSNMSVESRKFAAVMGMANKQWLALVEADSIAAFKKIMAKIATLPTGVQEATIKDLYGSGRLFSLATKFADDAANGFKTLNRMLETSNQSFKDGTSSLNEYKTIMESLTKQSEVLGSSASSLAAEMGGQLIPVLKEAVQYITTRLNDPAVRSFFVDSAKSVAVMANEVGVLIAKIQDMDINWTNVIATLRVLTAISLAKWGLSLFTSGKSMFIRLGDEIAKVGAKIWALAEVFNIGAALLAGRNFFTMLIVQAGKLELVLYNLSYAVAYIFSRIAASINNMGFVYTTFTLLSGLLQAGLSGVVAMAARAGAALLAMATGPVGVIILAIAAIAANIWYSWDRIKAFFGFVDAETDKRKREAARIEQEAKKRREDMLSQVAEMNAELNKTPAPVKDTLDLAKTGNATAYYDTIIAAAQRIQKLQSGIVASKTAENASDERLVAIAEEKKKKNSEIFKLLYQISVWKTGNRNTLSDVLDMGDYSKNIANAESRINVLRLQLGLLNDEQKKVSESKVINTESIAKANIELEKSVLDMVAYRDETVNAYAATKAAIVQNTEAVDAKTTALDKLMKKATESNGKISEGEKALVDNLKKDIELGKIQIEQYKAKEKYLKDTTVDPMTKNVMTKIDTAPADALKNLANMYDTVGKSASSYNSIASDVIKVVPSILATYFATKKVAEGYKMAALAATAVQKTATSVFNNTGTELETLRANMTKFAVNLNTKFSNVRMTLKLDIANQQADEWLVKRKGKINEYYDNEVARAQASASTLMGIDAKLAQSRIAWLEKQRERALVIAEADDARAKAENQAALAIEQYKNSIGFVKSLIQQASEAAKAGDVSKALTLKDEAKNALTKAAEDLQTIAGMRTKSMDITMTVNKKPTIRDALMFNEDSIKPYTAMLSQATDAMAAGVAKINVDAKKAADETAQPWINANNAIQGSLAQQEARINLLKETFTGFTEIMAKAQQVFDNSYYSVEKGQGNTLATIEQLNSSVDKLKEAASNPINILVNGGNALNFTQEIDKYVLGLRTKVIEGFTTSGVDEAVSKALSTKTLSTLSIIEDRIKNLGGLILKEDAAQIDAAVAKYNEAIATLSKPGSGTTISPEITVTPDKVDKALTEARPELKPNITIDPAKVNSALNAGDIQLNVDKINLPPGSSSQATIPGHARGGYISGPGTSTSDSILSWLSNGEFVIDAFTTGFFGSSFFSGLQTIARSGRTSMPGILKGGSPALATGGPVNAGVRNAVDVNFNFPDGTVGKLVGAREEVDKITKAMQQYRRGKI